MERTEVRLECLKLACRPDHSVEVVLSTAKLFEEYVSGSQEKNQAMPKQNIAQVKIKKSDNADILS